MTSISSLTSSPFANMAKEISSAVDAGVLSQTDATALDDALTTIGSALSDSTTNGSTAPGDMKSKVDSLISQQVSSGKLTQDQAKELQAFFAQGPSGPPPSGQDTSTASTDSTTTNASSSDDQYKALLAFLQNLKADAANDSASYSIGQSNTSSTTGTLFSTSA